LFATSPLELHETSLNHCSTEPIFKRAKSPAPYHATFRRLFSFSDCLENRFLKKLNHKTIAHQIASKLQAFSRAALFLGSHSAFTHNFSKISATAFHHLFANDSFLLHVCGAFQQTIYQVGVCDTVYFDAFCFFVVIFTYNSGSVFSISSKSF
jgi:hypothetical protein